MRPRLRTVFELCPTHYRTFAFEGRARLAEIFCEGGPGHGPPCSGDGCHIYPGTDLYVPELCNARYDTRSGEFAWAVNQPC